MGPWHLNQSYPRKEPFMGPLGICLPPKRKVGWWFRPDITQTWLQVVGFRDLGFGAHALEPQILNPEPSKA